MKPNSALRSFLLASSLLAAAPSLLAQTTYYWNQNGTAAGWGAVSTWNTTNTVFSTTNSDTATAAAANTTVSDTMNFGNSTVGFGSGATLEFLIGGTQNIGSINIGSKDTRKNKKDIMLRIC